MTALGISKRQEFYNRERRHWRGADAVFCIAAQVEKYVVICYNIIQGLVERILNMKVYILASLNNISFAEKLLSNIRNAKIISKPSINEVGSNINVALKRKMESADVGLAIIDEKFSDSVSLNLELQLAQMSVRENRNKVLIPVVLNKADVPKCIEGTLYIDCISDSEQDLCKTQLMIEKVLTHRKYIIRKGNLKGKNSRTSSMIIMTLAIEMFAMLFIVLLFKENPFQMGSIGDESIITITFGIASVMLAFVALLTSYLSIMKRRWQEDDEEELESYSRRLKRAIVPEEIKQEEKKSSGNEGKKKEIDALERMMINLEDIKEFYTWSQKQAKASFILAVIMCISGFGLMIVAILIPIVFRLSFQMSIIPAIGGVITELIAGTALVVYRNSLSQLNHYHKALHEDERFLSSVNLLGKFSSVEAQDDMLREIIRSEIQMNLAELQENENREAGNSK